MTFTSAQDFVAASADYKKNPTPVNNDINSTIQQFPFFFTASIAQNEQHKAEVFSLRHQVYCEELQYEPINSSCQESDQFDSRALHCTVRHKYSDLLAGTVRIITCRPTEQLPFEQHFPPESLKQNLIPDNFGRQHICEISRLAVPEFFRRKHTASANKKEDNNQHYHSQTENQCYQLIAVALYLIAALLTQSSKRFHVYMMIEPGLARVLKRIGIRLQCIGPAITFNGKRAPYYLDARTLQYTLQQQYRPLQEQLARQLFNHPFNQSVDIQTSQDASVDYRFPEANECASLVTA